MLLQIGDRPIQKKGPAGNGPRVLQSIYMKKGGSRISIVPVP